ncbi:hypothetical protein CONCODRAFT_3289 [Conidiobolus coronatus NRRL 28638]|uniref:G-protein coupled receptors family 1 profile domain-containing protein n=1 Tax=Conidiobolus coronatus (strain ATCC 28846 / CBS 209.66 / NRRL 28638) TaxID=796925 RepID=A0A137PFF1_CONC2|nr:hypothetical protein CONCODRAFT_3289 [Conidiobolus coronatus NRRL 28638]|eukprot:KXN73729.1 hypothetical protein CONCODRAFT_3289 [Conidiobolus coronatus NRRL 28638]
MDPPNRIYLTLHPIGMAIAILVLLSITGLFFINRQLTNRMTVRLVAVIAITDLLPHVGEFYAVENYNLTTGTPLCTSVNGFRLFTRSFYWWVNIAISFYIYRSLVLLEKPTRKFEIFIWTATAVLVIAETLIYYELDAFTGLVARKRCTPGVEDNSKNIAFLMFQSLTNLLSIATGIFVTVRGHSCHSNFPLFFISMYKLPLEALFLFCTAAAFFIDPFTHKASKVAYYQIISKDSDKKDFGNQYGMNNF